VPDRSPGLARVPSRRAPSRARTWRCPNPSEFSLLVVAQHRDVVVQLCGELDLEGAGTLAECLRAALAGTPRRLVLDLSALTFADSTGLATFASARRAADSADVELVLDSPTPPVRRVLELTGLDAQFVIR
jgi:anti-sigma B factor antagonist